MECTYQGRKLQVETWSNAGLFIEGSAGVDMKGNRWSLKLPQQGFRDDQGRLWSKADFRRSDGSDTYGWHESFYRWWLRPEGSDSCPHCGGDSYYSERGFVCPCQKHKNNKRE